VTAETQRPAEETGALDVFRNRPFLLLWLAQAATQIGGNMVIFGLVVIIDTATRSTTAVSALILTFLVPAVLFSAVAGVYVDRIDRRLVLIATNVLRAVAFFAVFLVGDNLILIYVLNIVISTITVFFAPAEAAMIPMLVPRQQLLAANGIFTLTLNAAFGLGFALMGPLVVAVAGPQALLLIVAVLYLVAAGFCFTLPAAPPGQAKSGSRAAVIEAEHAVESTFAQLGEGIRYIRDHRSITWSLVYLGITASLVGVLGVLGPNFARSNLGLSGEGFVIIVLPIAVGIVMGILLLNTYGKYVPRRRTIEGGLLALGGLLSALALSAPIARLIQQAERSSDLVDLSAVTSLLSVVAVIAFFAGIAYSSVAIPSQTQLQEDLPPEVRGRVFGVLNMLVSVASFLPILIVGPIADLVGTTTVILVLGVLIAVSGIASIVRRGPLGPLERGLRASGRPGDPIATALGADLPPREQFGRPLSFDPAAAERAGAAPAVGAPAGPAEAVEADAVVDEAPTIEMRVEPGPAGGAPDPDSTGPDSTDADRAGPR